MATEGEATPPSAASPSATSEPDLQQAWDDAVAYVNAVNEERHDAAMALTDGSTWAFKYATHQKAIQTAQAAAGQGGFAGARGTVKEAAGTVTINETGTDGQTFDTIYGNFVTDANGKIAAFASMVSQSPSGSGRSPPRPSRTASRRPP